MNGPTTTLTPADPATVFLSYARDDLEPVERLERALKLRGVRVLRDIPTLSLGAHNVEALRAMIAEQCDAIIFYASAHLLASDFVWRYEVPEALARRRRQPGFHVISILPHGVSFDALAAACADHGLELLADFNAVPLTGTTPSPDELSSIGRRSLASAFSLRCARGSKSEAVGLCLRTFPYAPPADELHLDLDWSDPFTEPGPSPDDWASELAPALRDVAAELARHRPARGIDAWVKTRLPAALALGHAFPPKGATHLRLHHESGVWLPDGPSGDVAGLSAVTNRLGTDPTAIVELSISRDVTPAVSDWCRDTRFTPGWRLRYAPVDGPSRASVVDAAQAGAWVRRVGDDVRDLWDKERVGEIHLFVAAPVEFAVMLGQQLRDKRHIHVYAHGPDGCHLACVL